MTAKKTSTKKTSTKKSSVKVRCKTGKNGKKTCKTITKTVKKNAALPARVAGAACVADVSVVNAWPGGYQAVVRVTNNGTTDLTSWTASGGSSAGVTQVWGGPTATATSSSSGLSVTATRGATLAAGASVSTGVVASGAPSVGALTCSAG